MLAAMSFNNYTLMASFYGVTLCYHISHDHLKMLGNCNFGPSGCTTRHDPSGIAKWQQNGDYYYLETSATSGVEGRAALMTQELALMPSDTEQCVTFDYRVTSDRAGPLSLFVKYGSSQRLVWRSVNYFCEWNVILIETYPVLRV